MTLLCTIQLHMEAITMAPMLNCARTGFFKQWDMSCWWDLMVRWLAL